MSQPPPYNPSSSFVSYTAGLPGFPGQQLDVEFNNVKRTANATAFNLGLIQRDDGRLGNSTVGPAQLSPELLLAGLSVNPIPNTYNLRSDYGAAGDGVTDDTNAIQAWLNAVQTTTGPAAGYAPRGNYIFKGALSIGAGGKNNIAIHGDGPYETVFTYNGSSTTIDLLTVGDGISECHGWNLHDFRFTSTTTMSSGSGLHTKLMGRSSITNVIMDGQDGFGTLWNGFWFDGIDTTTLDGFEARGQNDGLRVNGKVAGPQSDLFVRSGKIALSGVGLHIGGAMGGVNVDDTDIIANSLNVLVDQTITASPNNQLFFGKGCAIDSGVGTPQFSLLDVGGANSVLIFTGTWMATGAGNGLQIGANCAYRISYIGGYIGNHQHDGVYDGSGGTAIMSFVGVQVRNNGGSGTGYGFNASGNVFPRIESCAFENNFSGNIAPVVNGNVAGGSTNTYLLPFGNGISITYGSGPPTIAAAQCSLYMRTDGSTTTNRLYINTNGSTTWTPVVTSA
jgi:hypothetical protein